MGGKAFKAHKLSRILFEEVEPTVAALSRELPLPGFSTEYAMSALLGSTLRKDDSGDLDIGMNTYQSRFVGELDHPIFDIKKVFNVLKDKLPNGHYKKLTDKMDILQFIYPIHNKTGVTSKYVQVDFIFGKLSFLQASYYGPGKTSRFKGLLLNQSLGILAKTNIQYEKRDENHMVVARIRYQLDLTYGLTRVWELLNEDKNGLKKCKADQFETKIAECPRCSRIGYIDDPDTMIQTIFCDEDIRFTDINSFEKLVTYLKTHFEPEQYVEFYDRLLHSLAFKHMTDDTALMSLCLDPIWQLSNSANIDPGEVSYGEGLEETQIP